MISTQALGLQIWWPWSGGHWDGRQHVPRQDRWTGKIGAYVELSGLDWGIPWFLKVCPIAVRALTRLTAFGSQISHFGTYETVLGQLVLSRRCGEPGSLRGARLPTPSWRYCR
jgi:hypothetical protein